MGCIPLHQYLAAVTIDFTSRNVAHSGPESTQFSKWAKRYTEIPPTNWTNDWIQGKKWTKGNELPLQIEQMTEFKERNETKEMNPPTNWTNDGIQWKKWNQRKNQDSASSTSSGLRNWSSQQQPQLPQCHWNEWWKNSPTATWTSGVANGQLMSPLMLQQGWWHESLGSNLLLAQVQALEQTRQRLARKGNRCFSSSSGYYGIAIVKKKQASELCIGAPSGHCKISIHREPNTQKSSKLGHWLS